MGCNCIFFSEKKASQKFEIGAGDICTVSRQKTTWPWDRSCDKRQPLELETWSRFSGKKFMVKYNFLFHFFLLLDVIFGSIPLFYKPFVLICTADLLWEKNTVAWLISRLISSSELARNCLNCSVDMKLLTKNLKTNQFVHSCSA